MTKTEELKSKVDAFTLPDWVHNATVNGVKIPVFKTIDLINQVNYPLKPPVVVQSDKTVCDERTYAPLYEDFKRRITPEGLFAYHIDSAGGVDVGDQCFHQGIALAVEALRLSNQDESERDFSDIERLINGITSHLITDDGLLIRGITQYKYDNENSKWTFLDQPRHPRFGPSGDQLIGLCFGLTVLRDVMEKTPHIDHNLFPGFLIEKIEELTVETAKKNNYVLKNPDGSNAIHGYFNPSASVASGAAIAALSLLNVARLYSGNDIFKKEYERLGNKSGYFKLARYGELHLQSWNNWFGLNVSAMGLVAAGYKRNNKDVNAGLTRLNHNSRHYGHALYLMLEQFTSGALVVDRDKVSQSLHSYFYTGEMDPSWHVFKKWFPWSKKTRVKALPKRLLPDRDFIPQRNPFRDPEEGSPKHDWMTRYAKHDILLEFHLATYLGLGGGK